MIAHDRRRAKRPICDFGYDHEVRFAARLVVVATCLSIVCATVDRCAIDCPLVQSAASPTHCHSDADAGNLALRSVALCDHQFDATWTESASPRAGFDPDTLALALEPFAPHALTALAREAFEPDHLDAGAAAPPDGFSLPIRV